MDDTNNTNDWCFEKIIPNFPGTSPVTCKVGGYDPFLTDEFRKDGVGSCGKNGVAQSQE